MRRTGAAAGTILAVLLAISYLLGGRMPAAGTPPPQLLAFLRANSATQEWSWFLACGPVLLFGPWFIGVLTARLWEDNAGARELTVAGFASALLMGALLAAAGVTWGLFVYLGTQVTNPSLLLVLAESRHFAEGSAGFPAAGAVIAFTLAARGRLPGWSALAALAAVAAGLQLANAVDDFAVDGITGPLGPASFAALLAWLLAVSAALLPEEAATKASSPSPWARWQPGDRLRHPLAAPTRR